MSTTKVKGRYSLTRLAAVVLSCGTLGPVVGIRKTRYVVRSK